MLVVVVGSLDERRFMQLAENTSSRVDMLHARCFEDMVSMARGAGAALICVDLDARELTERIDQLSREARIPIVGLARGDRIPEERGRAKHAGLLEVLAWPKGRATEELERELVLLSTIPIVNHNRRMGTRERGKTVNRRAGAETPLLGVVASTGGPRLVRKILSDLPDHFSGCILLVQHMWDGFERSFVDWLDEATTLHVNLADDGDLLNPGQVWVAPPDCHLRLSASRSLELDYETDAVSGFCPSGDVLFESMALHAPERSTGIVLTGIGTDGARGLRALRDRGGRTAAQDGASSVIDGMPRAARELDAAEVVLPENDIANFIADAAGIKRG